MLSPKYSLHPPATVAYAGMVFCYKIECCRLDRLAAGLFDGGGSLLSLCILTLA